MRIVQAIVEAVLFGAWPYLLGGLALGAGVAWRRRQWRQLVGWLWLLGTMLFWCIVGYWLHQNASS